MASFKLTSVIAITVGLIVKVLSNCLSSVNLFGKQSAFVYYICIISFVLIVAGIVPSGALLTVLIVELRFVFLLFSQPLTGLVVLVPSR